MGAAPHSNSDPTHGVAQEKPFKQGNTSSGFPGLPPKDCKACEGAVHMIDAFRRLTHSQPSSRTPTAASVEAKGSSQLSSNSKSPSSGNSSSDTRADSSHQTAEAQSTQGSSSSASEPASTEPRERLQCPPDTFELGRSTWTFLHTMAAYYPEEPSRAQKSLMRSMMEGLAEFYPCSVCADHLREQVTATPPDVSSNTALSMWLCRIHNEVNEMLGKPLFDCQRVMERWREGPADGESCD